MPLYGQSSGSPRRFIRSLVNGEAAKIDRPKERAARSRSLDKGWCRHEQGLNDSESC